MTIKFVVGPPGAGKSTYIKEHAKPEDLVIEWDELAAIHGKDKASQVRNILVTAAPDYTDGDVWISRVKDTADPETRRAKAEEYKADEVIVLETDADTAKARIGERDKDDADQVKALQELVDTWWSHYGVVASDVIVKPSGNPPPSDMETNQMAKGFPDNTKVEDMTEAEQVAYWKHHSRKHEQALKDLGNIEELKQKAADWDDYQKNRDKDQEELDTQLKAARTEGRKEALRETALDRVKETFKTRIGERRTEEEIDDFLEDIDLAKFVTDDHKVDTDRITKKVELFAPGAESKQTPSRRRSTSTHQGTREGSGITGVAAGKALFEEMNKKG